MKKEINAQQVTHLAHSFIWPRAIKIICTRGSTSLWTRGYMINSSCSHKCQAPSPMSAASPEERDSTTDLGLPTNNIPSQVGGWSALFSTQWSTLGSSPAIMFGTKSSLIILGFRYNTKFRNKTNLFANSYEAYMQIIMHNFSALCESRMIALVKEYFISWIGPVMAHKDRLILMHTFNVYWMHPDILFSRTRDFKQKRFIQLQLTCKSKW